MHLGPANRLLASFSVEGRSTLLARAIEVSLPLKTVLYNPEETPRYVYFLTSGMASIVTFASEGETAEVGIVGHEGMIGSLHLLGPGNVSSQAFIQIEGAAVRVPFTDMHQAFRSTEEIRDRVLEFIQQQAITTHQIAGCNRLHGARARLARWLLMAEDTTEWEVLDLTQELLATMLGARRSTVTMLARSLQRAGLIEYRRGHLRILDRPNLEAAACDCYDITKKMITNLYRLPAPGIRHSE
jgi:CRP-like cAMP-binding protein